jgi:hypothetical protein
MLNGRTRSILVCQRGIVASFLADVLCAASRDLCGRFTSVAIRKASSPAHGCVAGQSTNVEKATKAKCA